MQVFVEFVIFRGCPGMLDDFCALYRFLDQMFSALVFWWRTSVNASLSIWLHRFVDLFILRPPCNIFTEILPGNPSVGGVKRKRGSKIDRWCFCLVMLSSSFISLYYCAQNCQSSSRKMYDKICTFPKSIVDYCIFLVNWWLVVIYRLIMFRRYEVTIQAIQWALIHRSRAWTLHHSNDIAIPLLLCVGHQGPIAAGGYGGSEPLVGDEYKNVQELLTRMLRFLLCRGYM